MKLTSFLVDFAEEEFLGEKKAVAKIQLYTDTDGLRTVLNKQMSMEEFKKPTFGQMLEDLGFETTEKMEEALGSFEEKTVSESALSVKRSPQVKL